MLYQVKKDIPFDDLNQLYTSVKWTGYTDVPLKMKTMLSGSLWWMSCYVEHQLVGLVRVVGDGVSIIYVQDLLVHPHYQSQGIGTKLLKRVLEDYKEVRQIVLITDNQSETKQFYESLGFTGLEKTNGYGFIRYNFQK